MNEAIAPQPHDTSVDRRSWRVRLVTASCWLALAGLAVTVVHLLWPTPLMFALFMTVGQGAFAAAMVLYAAVILRDLKLRKVL